MVVFQNSNCIASSRGMKFPKSLRKKNNPKGRRIEFPVRKSGETRIHSWVAVHFLVFCWNQLMKLRTDSSIKLILLLEENYFNFEISTSSPGIALVS